MNSEDITGPQSGSPGSASVEFRRTRERPRERADAARNRTKVLDAAASLFAEHGVENVSMDAVAKAAGVGKGTLFRRFGDKAGLATALLDDRERDLQERLLTGSPPLGPGTPAGERLRAFVQAYADYVLAHLPLVRMSETATPGARYRIGAYDFWHRHVAMLLTEARGDTGPEPQDPDEDTHAGARETDGAVDADALAHAILAPLSAEHLAAMAEAIGERRARAAALAVADALCPSDTA